jgi:hypothetical protein
MIITIDPSGTSTTACFLFENWNSWEFISFTEKNWLNQVKNLENLLKNKQPNFIAYENSNYLKNAFMNSHFTDLLKVIAGLELILAKEQIKSKAISNIQVAGLEGIAREGKIAGLVFKKENGLTGRPKLVWYFKGKELSEHEKDALLVFYCW